MLKKLIIYMAVFAASSLALVHANTLPTLQATVGTGGDYIEVTAGTTLAVTGRASDMDGDMSQHWLEIQNPAGAWSWEGWLTGEPWAGALGGSSYSSVKNGSFTFSSEGNYLFRTTAIDSQGYWCISNVVQIHVTGASAPVVTTPVVPVVPVVTTTPVTPVVPVPPVVTPVTPLPEAFPMVQMTVGDGSGYMVVTPGTALKVTGTAKDADGDMTQHWLEIQNPAGSWSWEGWLTEEPWAGALVGNSFMSVKTTSYTFDQVGTYLLRTTAIDPHGIWSVSNVVHVVVQAAASVTDVTAPVVNSSNSTLPSIFKADGSVDPVGYLAYFTAWDHGSVSARLGPTFAQLNPNAIDDRPTNFKPTSKPGWLSFSNRTDPYELGPVDGPAPDNDYWSESGQVAYVPDDPIADPGIDRIQTFAYYNNVFAISPRLDYASGIPHPEPQTQEYNYVAMLGHTPRQPVAMVRDYAMIQNEALVVYRDGLLGCAGTQTSREGWARPYPGLMLPPEKVPTGIAITASNEFALITVWDTKTLHGQIAVVALEGKYIAYHTWPYMALPNQGSWSDMKLLGYVDLPMAAPSSISAASNGWWEGPSQTAGESFSQIDLTNPWTRDGFLNGNPQWTMVIANKGYAVVASKLENKAVLVDLSPLFNYARQSYLSSAESYWATVNSRGSGPGQWPLTFAEKPDIMPTVVWQMDVASPSSVLAAPRIDRWSMDRFKAYIASEDGTIHIVDTSSLMARYEWEQMGAIGEMGTVKVGRNPVSMAFARHLDYNLPVLPLGMDGNQTAADPLGNTFYAACRGDREVDAVVTFQGNGAVYRRIRDSRMSDPVGVSVAGRGYIVSVTDFSGRKLLSFRVGGLWDRAGRFYGPGENGNSDFEFAGELPFQGYPFAVNTVNVN